MSEARPYMDVEILRASGKEKVVVYLRHEDTDAYPWRATIPGSLDRYGDPYEGCARARGWGPDVAVLDCLTALLRGGDAILLSTRRLPEEP